MPDDDALTAAREKVLDWGPDIRQPARMERFRQDVAKLERLAAEWAAWNAAASGLPFALWPEDADLPADAIVARYSDGSVWTPEEIGEALAAVAAAAEEQAPRLVRPLPVPGHSGHLQSDGGPWTCVECNWTEGDPPREHDEEEPAT